MKLDSSDNMHQWIGKWNIQTTLFGDASDECCSAVAALLKAHTMHDGEILFREGDQGSSMFFLNKGSVLVQKGLVEMAILSSGNYFGELGLMLNDGRTATIICDSEHCELLELSRTEFYKVFPSNHIFWLFIEAFFSILLAELMIEIPIIMQIIDQFPEFANNIYKELSTTSQLCIRQQAKLPEASFSFGSK